MTKQQLLADLLSHSFVDGLVGEPSVQAYLDDGSISYTVKYREVVDLTAKEMTLFIYVVDEGETTERAFYKNKEPVSQLEDKFVDIVTDSQQFKDMYGKVVEADDSFVIVDGFEDNGEILTRIRYRFTQNEDKTLNIRIME